MKSRNHLLRTAMSFLLLLACYASKSQTLEHTYPTFEWEDQPIQCFRVSDNETLFARVNLHDSSIHVYSSAHALIATIKPDTPSLGVLSLRMVSRKLFDTDNDIEIVLTHYRKGVFVVNENGSIKFAELPEGGSSVAVNFFETDNGPKMAIIHSTYPSSYTKIYDLENVTLGKKELNSKSPKRYSFPNPAETQITIPNDGKQSNLAIYNTTGQLIDEKTISGDHVYDASNLAPGIYLYHLNGQYAGKFVKE